MTTHKDDRWPKLLSTTRKEITGKLKAWVDAGEDPGQGAEMTTRDSKVPIAILASALITKVPCIATWEVRKQQGAFWKSCRSFGNSSTGSWYARGCGC